jgi:alpha-tubulin suppressor-like RCC1 family protein
MRSHITRIGIVAVAALALAACRDDRSDLVAPKAPNNMFLDWPPPGGYTIQLPNPDDFVDITAGDFHTCARKNNGDVYCWGQEGGPAGIASVVATPRLAFQGAIQIDAGALHTCVLNNSRAAYCWGGGNQGQLGLANGQYSTYNSGPVAGPIVPPGSPAQGPLSFTSISAGGYSTCGTASSGVYCWGQLGNVTDPRTGTAAPFQISSWNGFASVTVGGLHACGYYYSSHEPYCWGSDTYGQVGADPNATYYYQQPSPAAPLMVIFAVGNPFGGTGGVARVTTEQDFTCADMQNGTVKCFGYNYDGALGNGQSGWGNFSFVPQLVGNGQQLHGVSTGYDHACALDQNNAAWCWGWGVYGQLGAGLSFSKVGPIARSFSSPVAVTAGHTYRAIAAGRNHTCAIGTDNHIYCWGQNNYRQLGTWIFDANGNVVTNGFSPNPVLTM